MDSHQLINQRLARLEAAVFPKPQPPPKVETQAERDQRAFLLALGNADQRWRLELDQVETRTVRVGETGTPTNASDRKAQNAELLALRRRAVILDLRIQGFDRLNPQSSCLVTWKQELTPGASLFASSDEADVAQTAELIRLASLVGRLVVVEQ